MMEQATEKQIKFMKQLGIEMIPGLTKATAREMIKAKIDAEEKENGGMGAPVQKIGGNIGEGYAFPDSFKKNGKEYHLTPENVKLGALECAIECVKVNAKNPDWRVYTEEILELADKFVEWIYGRTAE